MSQKDLLDLYDQLSLSFSPIEKLFQTMSAIDAKKHGSLTTNYGEIGERLSEQFKKELHKLLVQSDGELD
ncbi:hypothetical protein [Halodesulfovibrio marinisediminis]|uniref:Uncharacterized protein n=1 Tax=Halodesulfovibrio marinisediminis DSM 17456 TaxID=1121457 RepID=A0A1N6IX81_9BACT|nr:hypothetical protein [Halodesulfovibrio marinisediminis]SIO36668.1 hypothetical protein SAMN02745161_3025 [Halodesulfovibrio marinisediminis DSM 17456]